MLQHMETEENYLEKIFEATFCLFTWYLFSSQAAAARSPAHGPVTKHQTNESVNKDLTMFGSNIFRKIFRR